MMTRFVLLLTAIFAVAAPRAGCANQTYVYHGTPYTEAIAPYVVGGHVDGTLELTAALPANLVATDIPRANLVGFTYTDGVQTRTYANSTVCRLVLGTNAAGAINVWNIWIRADTATAGNVRFSLESYNIPGFTGDFPGSGVFPNACDSGALDPRARTFSAGTWLGDTLFASGFEG